MSPLSALAAVAFSLLLPTEPPAPLPRADLEPGFTLRIYQLDGDLKAIPTLAENQTPNFDEVRATLDLARDDFADLPAPFLAIARGTSRVTNPGPHTFRLTSDDGSRFTLGDRRIIDHDGRHGATPKTSEPIDLAAGDHPFLIEHFDAGGNRALRLEWSTGTTFSTLGPGALFVERDNARVTAPGIKQRAPFGRPGDGRPIETVHPSFTVEPIVAKGFLPMTGAMTLDARGRLIVGTFNPLQRTETDLPDIESKPADKLYALTGVHGDLANVTVSVAADGLYEPLGLCTVGSDLYVSHRRAVTLLRDLDGDGFFEHHEDIARGWEAWNYHQFTFGLLHREGKLYAALSTVMAPAGWEGMGTNAGPNDPLRGCILEIDIASRTFHAIAGGVRTPNGLGFGPGGSLFYCDNQGTWMPSNQMGEVVPGRFFGHFNNTRPVPKLAERFPKGGSASAWCDRPRAPAAIDLVHNDLANSPTQPLLIEPGPHAGPYAGQLLIGELTAGGIRRAALEQVNGQWQGAVFQFSQGFNVGINRMVWGPDGTLFVGGIGAGGNWNWKETRAGLERLTPTGKVPFEMLAIRARHDGFEIEFTQPVDAHWLADPANYTLRDWDYAPTDRYGGAKQNVRPLRVKSAQPSEDGRRVTLAVEALMPGRTVHIRTDPRSALTGEPIFTTEGWYTLNHLPRAEPPAAATLNALPLAPAALGLGVFPPESAVTLIGTSARAAFTRPGAAGQPPEPTRPQHAFETGPGYESIAGGDLTSRAVMGDHHLHVEWFAPVGGQGQRAGNSGVYLQGRYELQVLGTSAGKAPEPNEAGAIYGLRAPMTNASTGPGTWQAYDIFFRAPRFADGRKTEPARLTAYWNGHLIHNDIPIPAPTGAAVDRVESPSAADPSIQTGPLRLQDHETDAEGPVRYRNVWVAPLLSPPTPPARPWRDLLAQPIDTAWFIRGGQATFTLEAGVITGTTAPDSPNTFLVSKEQFGDFELIAECRQHPDLNSGIQIRSHPAGDPADRAARIRGYQVELDPSPRQFTGGIYDEARRGWLAPLTDAPSVAPAFKPSGWNQLRIVARGPVIRTYLNGVPAAELFDQTDLRGHIALQVHGIGKRADPLTVEFRTLRIRPLD
ncbi:MAG: family 16 glycoside hydrolase [Phycisphaerales bacterium]